MRLKNHTDLPTDWLRSIIAAVRPSGIANFDVRVSNYRGITGRGRAYWAGSRYHDRACPFIVVSIAPANQFKRRRMAAYGGYLAHQWGNRQEAAVWLLSHELRHLWQAKVKTGWRVWGARGQFSERDADAYALRMLRRYRRGELVV